MKNLLFATLLALCASLSALAQSTNTDSSETHVVREYIRFGYFSYNDMLRNSPGYNIAQQRIADLRKVYEKELKRNEEQFSKQFAEYVEGQQTFPENILLKRQKELQQLMDQSLQFRKEAQELLTKAEEELMEPVHALLKEAIDAVGKKRNYAYVLNTDVNAYPYISSDGENCTDAVLTQLGIK